MATGIKGADAAPNSLNNLTLLVVLKTLRGDVGPQDWERLQQRERTVNMVFDNGRVFTILMYYVRNGVDLDTAAILEPLHLLSERGDHGHITLDAHRYNYMTHVKRQ